MNTSVECSKVIAALVVIQEQMQVFKDGTNPHFKSKYATLDQILDTVKPVLKDQGLVALQSNVTEDNKITCVTTIFHESGEWVESTSTVHAEADKPQKYGSAITYARRYGLATALGIGLMDDDDGERAEEVVSEKAKADHLRRMKQKASERFKEFDIDNVVKAFDESNISPKEDPENDEAGIIDMLRQVETEELLIKIGKRAKELNDDTESSDQTPADEKVDAKAEAESKKKAKQEADKKKKMAEAKKQKAEEKKTADAKAKADAKIAAAEAKKKAEAEKQEESEEQSDEEESEAVSVSGPSGGEVDWENKPEGPEGDEVASDEWCDFILQAFQCNVEANISYEHLDAYLLDTVEGEFQVGIWKESAKNALGALYIAMTSKPEEDGYRDLASAFPGVFA